ncbi:MAG: SpoIIE family protein phosphatase, partial [Chlorobiales bacterium]|nr:SpoIIE family protein phosphatase [Chlorobiales bacterium]
MIKKLLEKVGIRKKESAFTRLSKQLLEFSSAFSTITDVSQLVPTAIGKIRDIMGVKEAALFLKNKNNGRFELAYSRNIMLNPKLRIRGEYYFEEGDKLIRWLLTNRSAFLMSSMTDVFSYFPEEEQDILRFINAELCLGLEAHNRFIGLISLGRRIDGSEFQETEKQLLAPIAAQAALAIENYRLQQEALEQMRAKRELEIAGELQRRLLPDAPPHDIPELDINGLCIPSSEVGGDYYDYISLPDRKLAVVIGDVAGHGMSAGLLMGMAKSCINTAVKIDHSVL